MRKLFRSGGEGQAIVAHACLARVWLWGRGIVSVVMFRSLYLLHMGPGGAPPKRRTRVWVLLTQTGGDCGQTTGGIRKGFGPLLGIYARMEVESAALRA